MIPILFDRIERVGLLPVYFAAYVGDAAWCAEQPPMLVVHRWQEGGKPIREEFEIPADMYTQRIIERAYHERDRWRKTLRGDL